MASHGVVFVHAHPDDESLSTGGTIARYSDEGAHVCLITCTNGELGEIAEVPGLGDPEDLRTRLGEVRRAELEESCRHLGNVDLRMLGYHDSGMDGTPGNDDPIAFVKQDLEQPIAKIAQILREIRPQVLVTYNAYGFYGHPDHIHAHLAALGAVERAADPGFVAAGTGEPHEVAKVYFTAMPKGWLRTGREMASELGFAADEFFSDEEIERIGTDDDRVRTTIDVRPYVERKLRALEAHRTQLGTTQTFLSIPEQYRDLVMGTEFYELAHSSVLVAATETDLFEGVTERVR